MCSNTYFTEKGMAEYPFLHVFIKETIDFIYEYV